MYSILSYSQVSKQERRNHDENYWHQDRAKAPSKQGQEVQKEQQTPEGYRASQYEEIPEMDDQSWRGHHAAMAA